MPAKLTTTINKIQTVPNPANGEIIGQFYDYMKSSDVSENHQNNCLKVVLFSSWKTYFKKTSEK